MFNGIIKNTGVIKSIQRIGGSKIIGIKSKIKLSKKAIGSSISCNGVCLTLTKIKNKVLFFYLSNETIKRSNFAFIKKDQLINLELSLKYGDELSGHYTQGHVDTLGKIKKIKIQEKTWIINFLIPKKYNRLIVEKASIHINGVSLTISKKLTNSFEINVIPHTLLLTNLKNLKKDNYVNIEFDIFSKYIIDLNK